MGVIISIILGICVIAGLMNEGEMGCMGGILVAVLVVVLLLVVGFFLLMAIGA